MIARSSSPTYKPCTGPPCGVSPMRGGDITLPLEPGTLERDAPARVRLGVALHLVAHGLDVVAERASLELEREVGSARVDREHDGRLTIAARPRQAVDRTPFPDARTRAPVDTFL